MDLAYKTTRNIAALKFVRAYPMRALLVWTGLHVFIAASVGEITSVGLKGTIVLAALASLVVFFDARRRRENGFLQNLGVSVMVPPSLAAATVVFSEVVLAILT